MERIGERNQRTLRRPAVIAGRGFITGTAVRAALLPAAAGAGVSFVRTDLPGRPRVEALAGNVTATARRTTLGPADTGVTLVEHVLAALAALKIDNCTVELDGPEPPGLDGSAAGFVDALHDAGVVTQPEARGIYAVAEPVTVAAGGATVTLHPPAGPGLRVTYFLDYGPRAPLQPQTFTLDATAENFTRDVAGCRTFLLETEAAGLRAAGVGLHLTAADVLVFGPRGPLNNRLRFADEPARHKVLDVLGDLALCGCDLAGHVVAYRGGHGLNVALARTLTAPQSVRLPGPRPAARRRAA